MSHLSSSEVSIREARPEDARRIHALIAAHWREGHLLARDLSDVTRHAPRFLVATSRNQIVACGELAPLSHSLAEVRSLVVATRCQGSGIGRRLVTELRRRARLSGFDRLCAFAHDPAYFARLGFSIVPHGWLPEKIGLDCVTCPLFRRCGQVAMLDDLQPVEEPRVHRALVHA